MGFSVKGLMRSLCAEIGWSYAIFWKAIRCGDSLMHLVWEDGHCEQTPGSSSAQNGGFSSVGSEVRGLVFGVIANEVHVVGDGMIGKAALTGKHEWVHVGSMPKGLVEINNQILAGMKTVAIIPVVPHGVVQLGSSQMIMENLEFINHVKGLFEQILCVPRGRLSDTIHESLGQELPLYESVGMHTSVQIREIGSATDILSSVDDNSNTRNFGHPESRFGFEPSASAIHLNKIPTNIPEVPLSIENMSSTIIPLSSSPIQNVCNPIFHLGSQLKNTCEGASGMFSNSDVKLINNVVSCDSNSRSQYQPLMGSYNIISSFSRRQLLSSDNDIEEFNSFSGDVGNMNSQCAGSSHMVAPRVLSPIEHSNFNRMFSGDMQPSSFTSTNKSSHHEFFEKQKYEANDNGPFHDREVQCTLFEDHGSCNTSLPDYVSVCSDQGNRFHQDSIGLENHRSTIPSKDDEKGNEKLEYWHSLNERISSSVHCSLSNDLFDALRLDQYKSGFSHGSLADEIIDGTDANAHKSSTDVSTYNALNDEICCSEMFPVAASDQLLDSLISQLNSGAKYEMDGNAPCKISLVSDLVDSPKQMNQDTFTLPHVPVKSEPAASSTVKPASDVEKTDGCFSKGNGGYKSQINLWIENGQKMNCDTSLVAHGKKVDGVGILNKKRSRPGESPRPRPKDRQMIQDRIKELREIVPNGAKYSIDALLEKTIKHMLFLQSVTRYAEKIKETKEPKIINTEEGLLLKDNFEGGATWAFEVGSRSKICPIVVEDLNPPRQMLVEMLCEERGLFLEIAVVVRSLGFTILKGVMETQNSKVWARFAVEANRDVTRMELFMSLVRLLELPVGGSKVPEGIDNFTKPHNMLPSSSSIPATGICDRLC